jgi:hypothetical protein
MNGQNQKLAPRQRQSVARLERLERLEQRAWEFRLRVQPQQVRERQALPP